MDHDLDFDKYCVLDRSPTTVLPSPRRHSRSIRSKDSNTGRRRSVHRNSEQVVADRKKIEFSSENASALFSSGGVADFLCSSDEDKERNVSSLMSISEQSTSFDPPLAFSEQSTRTSLSPAHLRGILRVENRNEGSFFEFSTISLEGTYTARRWNGLSSWIYTFHCNNGTKGNSNKWRSFKDSRNRIKSSSLIGQMVVTSHISGEAEEEEDVVTEYVLYNSAQVRPGSESGGIVIRAPSKKQKSSKLKNKQQNHSDDEDVESSSSCSLRKIHVVIPDGNHSFPDGDGGGPSSLLDRWRSGGVCDCGGWDMACRFDVFATPEIRIDHRNPLQLFVQGKREAKTAAFSMHRVDNGSYSVEFHAKLSALQVLSICIAFLHSSQAPNPMKNRDNGGSSQRVFAEEKLDDMMFLSDGKVVYPSVALNPPFSPMARV